MGLRGEQRSSRGGLESRLAGGEALHSLESRLEIADLLYPMGLRLQARQGRCSENGERSVRVEMEQCAEGSGSGGVGGPEGLHEGFLLALKPLRLRLGLSVQHQAQAPTPDVEGGERAEGGKEGERESYGL